MSVLVELAEAWVLIAVGFLTFAAAVSLWTRRARRAAVADAAVALADSDEPVDEPVIHVLRKVEAA